MSRSQLSDLVEATDGLHLSSSSRYMYKPLEHERSIRILALEAAHSADSPLKCDLREVPLSEDPRYEAISYAWGDPVLSSDLDLHSGVLKITESLFLALQRFRLEDRARYIWADAVCINQGDNSEKGRQVALMGEIYRRAQKVLVWLGPGDEYSGHVINLFRRLAARSDRYGVHPVKEALADVPTEYDWSGIDDFYSLSWFSRMWIVQEIALGPSAHIYYGAFDISWDDFMLAAHIQYRSVQQGTAMNLRLPNKFNYVKLLEGSRRYLKDKKLGPRLLYLLLNCRFSRCSDDRDRVYAMLGLKSNEDVEITPNYDEPANKAFIELAEKMLRKNHGNILYFAGIARRFQHEDAKSIVTKNTVHPIGLIPAPHIVCKDLPSWVPDWRITGTYNSFFINQAPKSGYSAASQFIPSIQFDPDDGTLSVIARSIDKIKGGKDLGSEQELDYNAHCRQVMLMKEFYDQQVGTFRPKNDDDALTVFARTIVADLSQANTRSFIREDLTVQEARNLWLQFVSTPYKDESPTEHFETNDSEGREVGARMQYTPTTTKVKAYSKLFCYRLALRNLLDDRQFIVTNEGLAGLAPAIAQPGDHIVLVAGFSVPLVLRPDEQDAKGRNRWYIIGDCFVTGMMYGELSELLKAGPWDWKMLS
ncbi:heterokaryon incompatibility protein-domain-containing protein [Xylogone sp. PMI_703]|nr:heterokaryon incompatibility protein-domain-containing protein [Xylogone sp. PMI_703]